MAVPARVLVPFSADVEAAVRLATAAVGEASRRESPPQDPAPRVAYITEKVRIGSVEGRLYQARDRSAGIAISEGTPELGLQLHLFYLADGFQTGEEYGRFLDQFQSEVGRVGLLPAGLAGLAGAAESAVLAPRGFAPYARSEMRFPTEAPIPEASAPAGIRLRTIRPNDEPALVKVHAAAFGHHFDFYLFRSDADPGRNSAGEIREMVGGRWGEFLPNASYLAEREDGTPVGACLFVRASYGPLLVSLCVDPVAQGSGVARALTAAGLRALRTAGETVIALNVTEGNARAVRLYERFGFFRTIGPGWGWYSTRIVPVTPDGRPSRPPPGPASAPTGSTTDGATRSPPA